MSRILTQSDAMAALRTKIDQLDQQLVTLLNERARIAQEVAQVKRAERATFFCPDRVAQVIEKISSHNPGPLLGSHLASIWREVMSACLALEEPIKVAVLGPQGTFCEQAALNYFGHAVELVYCTNFDEVFHVCASGAAHYGVVGRENSTEGAVARSLDLFLHSPLHVVGEVSLLVQHHLLRKSVSLADIQMVLAHPQALAQCQGWLGRNLPQAERRAVNSNAEGARLAATNADWAGIASKVCAVQYGLHTVAQAIQDEPQNWTRFAVICLPQTMATPPASGRDCTSLVVSVPNRPGALHDLLTPLKTHGVSMTRFESRPAKSGQWEYYFFIDIQGHLTDPAVHAALAELQGSCTFYQLLGSYPVAA